MRLSSRSSGDLFGPIKRAKAKRISIFNHKGGVGKTTLTYNISSVLAEMKKNVLIVDSDPQCNLTAYVIDNEVLDDLLDYSDSPSGATVWSAVKPIVDATGPVKIVPPIELGPHLWLLPGDIRLSDFEGDLNDLWRECFQRKRRGLAGTTALSMLINDICEQKKIDFVFYDTGPNIGPLNRAILLDCDFFIVPAAYDLFSIRALKTLGRTLYTWITDWQTIVQLAPEDAYLLPGEPKFLGYLPQQFSIYGGRIASHQRKYSGPLERGIQSDIILVLKKLGGAAGSRNAKLGEVKDFGQLVTASQLEGLPLPFVSAGNAQQRAAAHSAFKSIAEKIITLTK
ncbi:MAG: ParA family protein [Kiritimatiellales bacterium]|jgi:cellulose biosynthesis protein BcsQ